MLTDSLPKKPLLRAAYLKSDQLCSLEVPADDRLRTPARSIEEALNAEQAEPVRKACLEFLTAAADFYGVSKPQVRVLAARPLRVRENRWATELFGDYPSGKEADPRVDAHGRPEASHLVRDVSRDALPRVLPPPRLRTVRISGHAPHAGILRACRRTLPPRAVAASQTPFLGPAAERPLEDRLATHESRWVMPAFEAWAHAMTTARNWVSKVRFSFHRSCRHSECFSASSLSRSCQTCGPSAKERAKSVNGTPEAAVNSWFRRPAAVPLAASRSTCGSERSAASSSYRRNCRLR